jgi:hypothetical protein
LLSGEHDVLLESGERLRLSRRYHKEFQSKLGVGDSQLC